MTTIPANIRPALEDYYRQKRAERFGASAPSPAQEADFINELTAASESVVPLPDGSEAVITGGQMWDEDAGSTTSSFGAAPDEGKKKGGLAFFGMMAVVVLLLFGGDIAGMVGSLFGSGGSEAQTGDDGTVVVEGEETPSPVFTPMALPTGLDDIVTSTGVRVPLVVPRTLEVTGAFTTTTFLVMPVDVEVADWPCPDQGQVVACWVYGTVVNYLIGVPDEPSTRSLMSRLQPGDKLYLRLSTERTLPFTVDWVREVPRQQVEVLRQNHFGLTLVLLHGEGDTRLVARASYVAEEDMIGVAAAPVPVATTAPEGPVISVGGAAATPAPIATSAPVAAVGQQIARLGVAVTWPGGSVTPLSYSTVHDKANLRLLVENTGDTMLDTATWQVQLDDGKEVMQGSVEAKQIPPGGKNTVTCSAQGGAGTWQVSVGSTSFIIER
jgi:hypothetical protein